jgi:hypothetical protein
MSNEIDVFTTCTPEQFGAFVKVPASEVRRLMKSGVLPARGTYVEFSGAYIEHLRAETDRKTAEAERLGLEGANPYPEHSFLHRAYQMVQFDVRCTQGEFGKYCGISQQAVSQLVQKGVIHPEGTFLAWIRDYCGHLEDKARERRGY